MSRPQKLGYDEIKNLPARHLSHDVGKQLLTEIRNDGDVTVFAAKLSLKCTLGGKRIKDPVRSVHCLPHRECFDLRTYFEYHGKRVLLNGQAQNPQKICPVCKQTALEDDLRIDDYFAHILESVPKDVQEVQLFPDGSFQTTTEDNEPAVTVHDNDHSGQQSEEPRVGSLGPRGEVSELLKQSKAFQRTLLTYRTKKDLTAAVQDFLEKQRDELGSLLGKLSCTDQDIAGTRSANEDGGASALADDQAQEDVNQHKADSATDETVSEASHRATSSSLAHVESRVLPMVELPNSRQRRGAEPKANDDLEAVPVTFAPKGRKRRKSYASTRSKGRIVNESSKLARQQIEKPPEAYDFKELLEHDRFVNDGVVRRMPAKEFTAQYVRDSGLIQPLLFEDAPEALGMSVPQSEKFTLHELAKLIKGNHRFRLLDDGGHKSPSVSLKDVAEDCEKPEQERALPPGEILIEAWNTKFAEMITPPKVVSELDWVERYWPKELKQRQDLQGNDYGWRQKHCIINTKGCFFDFFVPFAGTAVWYHVLQGTLVSWLVEPSEENVRLFEDWYSQPCSSSANGPRPFFGDLVDKCTRLRMEAGSTVVIPSGWIRCDYATEDTVAVGGHFLHSYAMPQQIRALESEKKRRIPANYCYQFAPQLLWYYSADVVHKATGRQYRGPIAVDPRQDDDIPEDRVKQHTSPNLCPGLHEGLGNQAAVEDPLHLPWQVCYDTPQPDDWIMDNSTAISMLPIQRRISMNDYACCQPAESFDDEFVSSLTRRERVGLFSLLSYLKLLANGKKPIFAEGITRPRHLLIELENVLDSCYADIKEELRNREQRPRSTQGRIGLLPGSSPLPSTSSGVLPDASGPKKARKIGGSGACAEPSCSGAQ